MANRDEWTPYGLEAIRIRHLRRRRLFALLLALGLAGLWALMFDTTTTTQQEIFANGNRANGISFDVPEQEKRDGPVTVSISPGRVTRADTGGEAPQEQVQRPGMVAFEGDRPYDWMFYVLMYGPWLLLAAGLWFLGARKGKHDEVNYGVYKGAMPLELVTASASEHVVTKRWAKTSVFGKKRGEYLTPELARVGATKEAEA